MGGREIAISSAADVLRESVKDPIRTDGEIGDYEVVAMVQKSKAMSEMIRRNMYAVDGGDMEFATAMTNIATVLLGNLHTATGKSKSELVDNAVAVLMTTPLTPEEIEQVRRLRDGES